MKTIKLTMKGSNTPLSVNIDQIGVFYPYGDTGTKISVLQSFYEVVETVAEIDQKIADAQTATP